ncbi:MAG: septum formation protein Maf [FCB group bacterium]|nr:septum formation protein Maf [FCB group bacterium]
MTFPRLKRLAEEVGLVLASGSPRRKTILTEALIPFEVIVPSIEEKITPGLSSAEQAMELARQKVLSIDKRNSKVYLSCDTIVVYDDQILMKPIDEADALRLLKILSGGTHSVFTGLALYDSRSEICHSGVEESRVRFNRVSDEELLRYIATGEPLDKAGAYGIQGMGRFLVDTVEGNIDNVVGLPMGELERLAGIYWETYGE